MRASTLTHFALTALMGAPLMAQALDIVVTKTEDSYDASCDSDCSLREAVALASSTAGEHLIRLPAGVFQLSLPPMTEDDGWGSTILDDDFNLDGDLDVYNSLRIVGAGRGQTIIDGGAIDRVFEVFEGAALTLERLQLRNGRHSYDGGAIRNQGSLSLGEVDLLNNRASNSFNQARGGAIANYGSLVILRSNLQSNRVGTGDTTWALGGAVFNEGQLMVRDSRFSNNSVSTDDIISSGGALFNLGSADIARSLFEGNFASDGTGSAISNEDGGILKLSNSTVTGNETYGLYDAGAINNGSSYPYNRNHPTPVRTPQMQLIHVTVAANPGTYAVENHGALSVRNSLVFSGLNNEWDRLQGCVNRGPNATFSARGLMLSEGSGNCVGDLPPATDAQVFNRVLYPLADNNSTIPSLALRRGSPAVDAGVGSCSSHDQRGFTRPRDGDGDDVANCDLGAYERMKP